jgi:hypothetical protein
VIIFSREIEKEIPEFCCQKVAEETRSAGVQGQAVLCQGNILKNVVRFSLDS